MSKKSFKANVQGADRLFSINDTTSNTQATHDTSATQDSQATATQRINIRIDPDLKNYASDAAWKNRMSVTEYICHLIKKDQSEQENTPE